MEKVQGINRNALVFIMMTTFLGAMGLGIITPIAPYLVTRYVQNSEGIGAIVGLLTAIYAVCQFIAAPALGALSDRFGRRSILLICLLGSAVGYLLLGLGGALWVLFLGRIIDGLTGANNGIINACIADIIPPDERGKYFGWTGAAMGVGFILGPAIGGLLAKFGYEVPFYVAAVITFINVIYGFLFMPETLPAVARVRSIKASQLNPVSTLGKVMGMPYLRWLLVAMFIYVLPFSALQANLSLLVKDSFNWDADTTGVVVSVFGIMSIFVQAVLLQWLLRRLSEYKVAIMGAAFTLVAFLLLASIVIFRSPIPFMLGLIVFAVGEGFLNPALGGMISGSTGAQSQGEVQGGMQSIISLAGIAGPLIGGELYDRLGHASSYLGGVVLCLLTLWVLVQFGSASATQNALAEKEVPA